MASIGGSVNEKVFSLKGWGGLNEHPDGDTRLKFGEASVMNNWKITRDGNLKRRPGTDFVAGLNPSYTTSVSTNLTRLQVVQPDDIVQVYQEASATTIYGKVVLMGTGAAINDGIMTTDTASISGGTLSYGDETTEITDGVLTVSNAATRYTIAELEEILTGDEFTGYLYIWYDELPYALNANSIIHTETDTVLAGYLVTVEAVDAVSGDPSTGPIRGLWSGIVGGNEALLAACNGKVWKLYDATSGRLVRTAIGDINTANKVTFFPFDGKVYIMNGKNYYVYDGTSFNIVAGYVPLVAITISPVIDQDGNSESGETTGEYINLLTTRRRVWISPDGEHDTFPLPEQNIAAWDSECYVKDLSSGQPVSTEDYTVDTTKGWVTFDTAPAAGVNSYEICYKMASSINYRAQITGCNYAELFSGPTDNMVFVYGDGSNQAHYTGMDYDGRPRADYFPDQYTVNVGDSNTPLTAMVRHYGDLVCYKTDSTWAITQSSLELASGDNTIAIYCTPVNRDKGNVAPGQVRLVENNPVSASERELYHWVNSSYYTSTLSRDERQARRISDRIQKSIKEMDLSKACMWDDNDGQEFYVSQNKVTLVWNYATDTWYRYVGIDAVCMCNFHGEVLYGSSDGFIGRLTYEKMGDLGYPIKAEWESGAIDFGAANMRKYSSSMWVGLKPETGTSVDVCVITDRKDTFKDKVVSSEKAKVSGQPFMTRTKIKAKKFVFYRLLLSVRDKQPAVTVTDIEIQVRQTGQAK